MTDREAIRPGPVSLSTLQRMVADVGVGIFETSLDGRILYANQILAEYLGYGSAPELMAAGITSADFYVDPSEQLRTRAAIEAGETVHGRVLLSKRNGAGSFWANEFSSAIRDENGQITGYVGSFTDVNDLVETQKKLEEAEESYRRIFERATEGIYRSSLDGKQLRSNPALYRLNGYSSEKEHLSAVKDIATEWYVDPDRRDEFKEILERHEVLQNFESEIYRHGSRERIWISENAYLVRDEDGTPLYYEGTVRDITSRKQAELATREALEKAEAASKAKTDFLAHMSHELRTPLNAILGFSDLIRGMGETLSTEKIQEYADDIHRSGCFLLELINDVLDLSRIESGALPLNPVMLDLDAGVTSALETVRPLADSKHVTIDMPPTPKTRAYADERALQQCLLNLLSNAIKFTPPNSVVHIDVDELEDSTVVIRVRDQGQGVSDAVLKQLGEPFLSAENPSQAKSPGTGLGLAITWSLMERMNGKLTIQNASHGGAIASLVLPASAS